MRSRLVTRYNFIWILLLPFRLLAEIVFGRVLLNAFWRSKLAIPTLTIICLIVVTFGFKISTKANYLQGITTENSALNLDANTNIAGKVLKVPYFNQYLEPNGSFYPRDGYKMCGAATVVMIAAYYNKLQFSSQSELKSYMFSSNGLSLPSYCGSIGGAFGVTSKYADCLYSTGQGMSEYLRILGLKTKLIPISITAITAEIDRGHPIIFSTSIPYGHLAVVKGYTNDGRLVMNDPFKNTQDGQINANYSFNGQNAIYSLNYQPLNITFLEAIEPA